MSEDPEQGEQPNGERRRYTVIGGVVLLLLALAIVIPMVLSGNEGQESTVVEIDPSEAPATDSPLGEETGQSPSGAKDRQGKSARAPEDRSSSAPTPSAKGPAAADSQGEEGNREGSWWNQPARDASGGEDGVSPSGTGEQDGAAGEGGSPEQSEGDTEGATEETPPSDQSAGTREKASAARQGSAGRPSSGNQQASAEQDGQASDEPSPSKTEGGGGGAEPQRVASSGQAKQAVSAGELRWRVQVASYRSREKADALAAQLRDSGFQMGVEKALVDGRTYYRVLTRRVDSRQQADTLQKRLRDEGFEELLLKRKRM